MSADKRYTTIQLRRGDNADFAGKILASGEPAFALDTATLKIGDGVTTWASLSGLTAAAGGGSMNDVVDDGSPTLGGELNLDNHDIGIDVKNNDATQIDAGTPVYIVGYHAGSSKPLIAPADASDSNKMPALGIVSSNIAGTAEGTVAVLGVVQGFDTTSPINFTPGDIAYVAPGGGLTNVRPTGLNDQIQNLGKITKSHSINGRILLLGAGRSNDIPNSGNFSALTIDNNSVVSSNTTQAGGGSGVTNMVKLSQTEYNSISSPDSGTVYFIV